MKVRALIVDDEAPARERLKKFLAQNDLVELIGEAEDGVRAVEMIEKESPDVVLLDIQMPDLDGFGVIQALEKPPLIIFVTAYDEYAIRAFEVNALDYLLKPFTRDRLDRAIEKAQQELAKGTAFRSKVDALFETLKEQKRYIERIAVRKENRMLVIDVSDIDWIGTEKGPIYIHIKGDSYLTKYTMDELESRLNPDIFFRTHRSAIVNLTRIKEIVPWFAGTFLLRLTTGAEVELSRNQAKQLRKIIQW
jgi:DNA-binding LytR/AlgR family response regulator